MSDTSLIFNLLAIDKASETILGVKSAFGLLAVGVAAGAAAFGAKSIQMAADFQSATTRLITSAGETHANIEMVRSGMLDMAGQVGDSAQSLAKAMYTVESGGRHGAEGLLVLRAAAEGAKAEGADLTVVADALTSVLQDYHLKGSDAARVTSQMVAAVGAGKTTFEQFAGSLHSVLPIAQAAGISFEDVSAAIASMTVHGMSAEQATQNLADVIKHMIAPTLVQTKELAQLGLSSSKLADMVGKRGLTGTLQDLSQLILSHMGPSGRVLMDAFNVSKDAANNANVMISKMPKNLQDLAHQFQHNSITLKDWRTELKGLPPEQANLLQQFAALQNRASGFNDLLKSGSPAAQTYQDALRRVTGDATGLNVALMLTGENTQYVNDTLKTISGATTEAGNHVKGWSDIQNTFNQRMAEARATIGALTIRIGTALLPAAQSMLNATMSVVMWFTKHKDVAAALAITVGSLAAGFLLYKTYLLAVVAGQKIATAATAAWTAAQWLLNIAMDANPIGLVIIAIAALVAGIYLLWTHSAGFRDFFISLWGYIWGFLKGVGHWFANDFVDFFRSAWHWVQDHAIEAAEAIHSRWSTLINFFTGLPANIHKIAVGMWDGIKDAFRGAINWIIGAWNGLHFSIPGFDVFGMHTGGFNLGLPHMPYLASGGDVLSSGVAFIHTGERVTPAAQVAPLRNSGGKQEIVLRGEGPAVQALLRLLAVEIRGNYGGNVQVALGGHV